MRPARPMRAIGWMLAAAMGACGGACGAGAPGEATPGKAVAVLFVDRFDGSGLDGWAPDRRGVWSVREGRLRAELPRKRQQHSFAYFGSESWGDVSLEVEVCGVRGVDKGLAFRVRGDDGVGVDLRGAGHDDIVLYRGPLRLGRAEVPNRNGRWYTLRVEARGKRYRVFVDGRLVIDCEDGGAREARGRAALAAYTGGAGECVVLYDNVRARALR